MSEAIAAAIVRRITAGELRAGDRIVEQAIADEFETSRGPVREALMLLNARAWIELTPGSGARVAEREGAPQIETALIGGALLGLAYRFAATKSTDEEVEEFLRRGKKVIQLLAKPGASADAVTSAILDAGHYAVSLANNRQIDDVIGPVPKGALSGYTPLSLKNAQARAEAAHHWTELLIAFKTRDPVKAEEIGRSMVETAVRRILRDQLT
ncbi:MAG: GntR family transcriptional regulator [Hyphomonadaceae bacterium]